MPSVVADRGHAYKCTRCRRMGTKSQMSCHVVEAHLAQEEVPFWCGICSKRFYRADHLAEHHRRRHRGEEEVFLGTEAAFELKERDATQLSREESEAYYTSRQKVPAAKAPQVKPNKATSAANDTMPDASKTNDPEVLKPDAPETDAPETDASKTNNPEVPKPDAARCKSGTPSPPEAPLDVRANDEKDTPTPHTPELGLTPLPSTPPARSPKVVLTPLPSTPPAKSPKVAVTASACRRLLDSDDDADDEGPARKVARVEPATQESSGRGEGAGGSLDLHPASEDFPEPPRTPGRGWWGKPVVQEPLPVWVEEGKCDCSKVAEALRQHAAATKALAEAVAENTEAQRTTQRLLERLGSRMEPPFPSQPGRQHRRDVSPDRGHDRQIREARSRVFNRRR